MPNYNVSIDKGLNAQIIDIVAERKQAGAVVTPEAVIREFVIKGLAERETRAAGETADQTYGRV